MAVSRLLPLLAGIIVCFAAKSDQHAVSRFMQKAKEHFDAGNLQAAEQSLRDALTIEPNNAKALHRLFDLVCRANNGDEAERLEPLLLRAMPPQTNPHVYLILAGCFKDLRFKYMARSLQYYRSYSALVASGAAPPSESDFTVAMNQAVLLQKSFLPADHAEAEQLMRVGCALKPDLADPKFQLAMHLMSRGPESYASAHLLAYKPAPADTSNRNDGTSTRANDENEQTRADQTEGISDRERATQRRYEEAEELLLEIVDRWPDHTGAQARLNELRIARCKHARNQEATADNGKASERVCASLVGAAEAERAHTTGTPVASASATRVPNEYAGYRVPENPADRRVARFIIPSNAQPLTADNAQTEQSQIDNTNDWKSRLRTVFADHSTRNEPLVITAACEENGADAHAQAPPQHTRSRGCRSAVEYFGWDTSLWQRFSDSGADTQTHEHTPIKQQFAELRSRAGSDLVHVFSRFNPYLPFGIGTSMRLTTLNQCLDHLLRSANNATLANDAQCDTGTDTAARTQRYPHTDTEMAEPELYLSVQHKRGSIDQPPLNNERIRPAIPAPVFLTRHADMYRVHLWMGFSSETEPYTSALHHDNPDNLIFVLAGRKRFLLFSPADALNLYTLGKILRIERDGTIVYSNEASGGEHFCLVDPDNVDLSRFPLFAYARPMELWLEAGEILYLPHSWFHYVTSYGLHIAVNHWFWPLKD